MQVIIFLSFPAISAIVVSGIIIQSYCVFPFSFLLPEFVGPYHIRHTEAVAAAEAAAKLSDNAIFALATYTHDLKARIFQIFL